MHRALLAPPRLFSITASSRLGLGKNNSVAFIACSGQKRSYSVRASTRSIPQAIRPSRPITAPALGFALRTTCAMSSHSQDGFAHAAASASAPAPAPAPAPAQSSTSGKVTQPPWQLPVPEEPAPTLKVWNSLTRSKTEFVPMRAKHVTWYNCGPTVYDSSHMGHAR